MENFVPVLNSLCTKYCSSKNEAKLEIIEMCKGQAYNYWFSAENIDEYIDFYDRNIKILRYKINYFYITNKHIATITRY